MEKSRAYASRGVPHARKEKLSRITSIQFTERLEKYSGFRMHVGRPSKDDFSHITDRVASKLASWKGRLLNKLGRTTLANAVLASLPAYEMQLSWLPQYLCDHLDRSIQKFIWKGNNDKGMHMVHWDHITQPRSKGGLDVRRAREQNIALLGKLVWDIINSPDKLWVQVLQGTYLKGRHFMDARESKGSYTWNSINKAYANLFEGFDMNLGEGSVSVWFDPWLMHGSICELIPLIDIHDATTKVRDV